MDLYQLMLLVLNIACLALFSYISTVFLKSYLRTGVKFLGFFSASFMLLALSQAASATSNILEDPKISLTLYTLSSSTASAAFLVMLFFMLCASKEEAFAIMPPLLLVSFSDLLAFTISMTVSLLVSGKYLRSYLIVLSLTYFLRGLSSLLMLSQLGIHLLITSELLKASATLVFATYHLSKVIKP
ncbi:MAG: DUF5985 family protein [Zestosphaera sp.]